MPMSTIHFGQPDGPVLAAFQSHDKELQPGKRKIPTQKYNETPALWLNNGEDSKMRFSQHCLCISDIPTATFFSFFLIFNSLFIMSEG